MHTSTFSQVNPTSVSQWKYSSSQIFSCTESRPKLLLLTCLLTTEGITDLQWNWIIYICSPALSKERIEAYSPFSRAVTKHLCWQNEIVLLVCSREWILNLFLNIHIWRWSSIYWVAITFRSLNDRANHHFCCYCCLTDNVLPTK